MGDSWVDDLGSGIQSTAKSVYNWGSNELTPTKPDLSSSQGANTRAKQAVGAYGAERQNYQPMTAPQIGGGTPGAAAYGSPPGAAPTARVQPPIAGTDPRSFAGVTPTAPGASMRQGPANANAAGAYAHGPPQPDASQPIPLTDQTRQQGALDMLQGAANGTTPSAAQIQSNQQLGTAMANQYALASGLQGRHPGAAFDAAARGAATAQGTVIGQGAVLRANEQAQARDAYATATGGARGQDIQVDVANLNAKLTTMGYDEQTRNALLQAQLTSQGYDVATANAMIAAQTQSAESANKFKGGIINGGAGAVAALL